MADDVHDVLGTLLIASGCAEEEHDIGPSFFPFPPSLASPFCLCHVELQLMALLV